MNRPPAVQGRQVIIGERRGRWGSARESKPVQERGRRSLDELHADACQRVAKLQQAIDLVGAEALLEKLRAEEAHGAVHQGGSPSFPPSSNLCAEFHRCQRAEGQRHSIVVQASEFAHSETVAEVTRVQAELETLRRERDALKAEVDDDARRRQARILSSPSLDLVPTQVRSQTGGSVAGTAMDVVSGKFCGTR